MPRRVAQYRDLLAPPDRENDGISVSSSNCGLSGPEPFNALEFTSPPGDRPLSESIVHGCDMPAALQYEDQTLIPGAHLLGEEEDEERIPATPSDYERITERLLGQGCSYEYEQALMPAIVDTSSYRRRRCPDISNSCTANVNAGYQDLFVDRSVIEQIERVTALSLRRPDAFTYGILSRQRITGALLYGPPGTGKSALAKSLAKSSGYAMMSISSADIFQKCWGEDEKMIRAIFSLAKKLHPCIVFLDEADAILGARKSGDKKHVRGMINYFLQAWDGATSDTRTPFILLATNRPFDLDPAVLRRAPEHIHIGVPTPRGRQEILRVHLKEEKLANDVNLSKLASRTPQFTGSDLKTLCVNAALVCISREKADPDYPPRRILEASHFEIALASVRPTKLSRTMLSQLDDFHKRSG